MSTVVARGAVWGAVESATRGVGSRGHTIGGIATTAGGDGVGRKRVLQAARGESVVRAEFMRAVQAGHLLGVVGRRVKGRALWQAKSRTDFWQAGA